MPVGALSKYLGMSACAPGVFVALWLEQVGRVHYMAGVSCKFGSSLCQHGIPLSLPLLCFGSFLPWIKIPLIYGGMLSVQLSSLVLMNGIVNK